MPKTADALIAEKIGSGAWGEHAWKSENWLVNASTLGLMLSGSLMEVDPAARKDPGAIIFAPSQAGWGEPVIRAATVRPCAFWANSSLLGRNIKAAIRRGHGWRGAQRVIYPLFSIDMLGEGARTARDAARYHQTLYGCDRCRWPLPRRTGGGSGGRGVSQALRPAPAL